MISKPDVVVLLSLIMFYLLIVIEFLDLTVKVGLEVLQFIFLINFSALFSFLNPFLSNLNF